MARKIIYLYIANMVYYVLLCSWGYIYMLPVFFVFSERNLMLISWHWGWTPLFSRSLSHKCRIINTWHDLTLATLPWKPLF